ncbi:response regulator transcription factor [Streptomyces sp. NPDC092129]|uniref:response regulator n=1 Tax=Streptomyces sp. NPDC092129 TaxID=3366010 RepID=UPI003829E29D
MEHLEVQSAHEHALGGGRSPLSTSVRATGRYRMVIHVLVADDSEIVRRGIGDVLESADDVHVVAQAWDGRSAVDAARQFSPDVALLDIRMPGMDGLAATREIRALPVPPRVIILTMFGEDEHVDTAVQAGASGFLLKDTPPEERTCCAPFVRSRRARARSTRPSPDGSWSSSPSTESASPRPSSPPSRS